MIEGVAVFLIVTVALVFAVRKLWAERDEDGGCSSCDVKPTGKVRH